MSSGEASAAQRSGLADKLVVPLVSGVILAVFAFVADWRLSHYTALQENARLITELQINREQAESELRKDVFDQALSALLSDKVVGEAGLSLSKRLLKLELLALNFGGTLSLSPLFTEFDRDLEELERLAHGDLNERVRIKALRKRLRGLASRLSSDQLSALEQYGPVVTLAAQLEPGGKRYAASQSPTDLTWPDDEVLASLGEKSWWGSDAEYEAARLEQMQGRSAVTLDGIDRFVRIKLGRLDSERRSVPVRLLICPYDGGAPPSEDCTREEGAVAPAFNLDFFNFPKIDNTRLSDNQRMGVVLERFDTGEDDPRLLISAVIFPAEHSSLRERSSMREAVMLLDLVVHYEDEADAKAD